jgi:hypothetical protein
MIPEPEQSLDISIESQKNDEVKLESTGWRLADGCVLTRVDGEPILLTPRMTYLKLDLSGELIVGFMIKKATMDEIVEFIVGEYAVERAKVNHDLKTFIEQLSNYGVVVFL